MISTKLLVPTTLGIVSVLAATAGTPAMRQVECERVDPASLMPQAEQAFLKTFRQRIEKGEISPDRPLNFIRDEFSFNQGAWLLPFKVASPEGQRTYFALVNCTSGVEFSVGDKLGREEPGTP